MVGERTEGQELQQILEQLKERGCIKADKDVVTHFLTEVFSKCIKESQDQRVDFSRSDLLVAVGLPYEWLDVPAQQFTFGLDMALKGVPDKDRPYLHVVPFNESEAAAIRVIQHQPMNDFSSGDLALVIDSGGLTSDAVFE